MRYGPSPPGPLSHRVGEGEPRKSPLLLGGRGDVGVRGRNTIAQLDCQISFEYYRFDAPDGGEVEAVKPDERIGYYE